MPHEHLAVSAFVVVHGALNSVFVSLLILIELSMYSRIANVAELAPFRLQQSGSWTKRVLCTITDKQWRMRTQREPRFLFTPMTIINIDIIDGIMFANDHGKSTGAGTARISPTYYMTSVIFLVSQEYPVVIWGCIQCLAMNFYGLPPFLLEPAQ